MKYYITETELFTFAGFGAVFYFLYSYNLFPFIIGIFVGGVLTILYMANFAVVKIWPLIRRLFLHNAMTSEMKPKTLFDIWEEIKRGSEDSKSEKSTPDESKEQKSIPEESKEQKSGAEFRSKRSPFYC